MIEGRRARTFIVGVSVVGVLSLALLPPEHVHERQTDDGHHSQVVHRHLAEHQPANGETSVGGHDDDPQWLDSPFTSQALVSHVDPGDQFAGDVPPAVAPLRLSRWAFRAIRVSVHDPPPVTPHGLRAPPFPA